VLRHVNRARARAALLVARRSLALAVLSAGPTHAQGPPASPTDQAPPAAEPPAAEPPAAEPPAANPPAAEPPATSPPAASPPAAGPAPSSAAAAPLTPPEGETEPYGIAQEYPDRSDEHAMPYGALLFSAGLAPISVYRVAVGSSQSVREAEGESMSSGTASLHFHYPIVPYFSARGFFRLGGFETDLSVGGGYRAHTLYMVGAAPALSFAVRPRKSQSVHLALSVPVGLVVGTQPGRPPRQAVEEVVNVGLGYRIGGALGMIAVIARHVGVTMDLEVARDDIYHRVTYRALDGRSPSRDLNLRYTLWSTDLTVGIAWVL
jgi:hypothetical protein